MTSKVRLKADRGVIKVHATESQQQGVIKASPMHRLGQVDEISGAMAWLAGDESSFMNRHAFTLAGGMLA